MARPGPAAPSSRVYLAFGLAAVIGLAVFAIWWLTSPAPPRDAPAGSSQAEPAAPEPPGADAVEAPAMVLPRGGVLNGSADAGEEAIARLTHATLVRVNRSTDLLEPWLAEFWSVSDDNLTYTLKLRSNLLWSDGTPLTADDIIPSIDAVEVMGKPLVARVLDAQTIEIAFPEPFAPGLRILDRHPILPRHAPPEDVGLGPFVRRPGQKGSPRAFVRNPHYWRTAPDAAALPYLDELTLAPRSPGRLDFGDAAIRAGDYEAVKKLEQEGKVRLFELGPGLDADALWFSPAPPRAIDRPWLTSETLRLAISAAVDRREYCKQVYFGACDPIAGPVSPANVAWFNPDLPLGRGDAQLARAMLAELGLRDRSGDGMLDDAARRPVRFSLLIRSGVAASARAAAFLEHTLRAVGVGIDVTALDAPALAARRAKGAYEAMYDLVEQRDTDPAMNLEFWLSSGRAHVWNPARQGAPAETALSRPADWERQIDERMLAVAATFDRIERLQAFVEVQRLYNHHQPALFFGAPHVRVYTSPRVLNATPSPLRPHLLWNAENLAALQP